MKLVNTLSILGIFLLATACGSSQAPVAAYNSAGAIVGGGTGSFGGYGSVLIGGSQARIVYGNILTATAYVNAGDHININLATAYYNVADATCGSGWNMIHTTGLQPNQLLTNATVTLNGQTLTGSTVAAASGALTLTATLDSFHIRCTDLYANQIANVTAYAVVLGNAVTK